LIDLDVSIQLPDRCTDLFQSYALRGVEADELGQDTLSVNPAQGVQQDVELSGVVADDNQVRIDFMIQHGAK